MITLIEKYNNQVIPHFNKKFDYDNALAVPKIQKVVINAGIGKEIIANPKFLDQAISEIAKITGQLPKIAKSKRAISGFKLRAGMPIGLVVTLRRKKMYHFLDKLINVVFPRIRDFRGVNKSALDDYGNLNIGIIEQTVFPEIKPEDITKTFGFQINIVTSGKNQKEAKALFEQLGIIFKKSK